MIQTRRIAMSAVILSAALALGACGIGNFGEGGGGGAPESVHLPKAAGHAALSVPSLNSLVAATLKADLHLRRVIVGEAPPGTAGLNEFLADPTTAHENAVNTGIASVGAPLWNVTTGVAQMPLSSSVANERAMVESLVRETVATFPAKVQAQITRSNTVYIDYAYTPEGIAYAIFWFGPLYG